MPQNSGETTAERDQNLRPWPKGVSGNPGGRPESDFAAELARLVFEGLDKAAIAKKLRKTIERNPRVFQVLADRAYGKLPIRVETDDRSLHDLTDEELARGQKRMIEPT